MADRAWQTIDLKRSTTVREYHRLGAMDAPVEPALVRDTMNVEQVRLYRITKEKK
jgi:hypothetical protein